MCVAPCLQILEQPVSCFAATTPILIIVAACITAIIGVVDGVGGGNAAAAEAFPHILPAAEGGGGLWARHLCKFRRDIRINNVWCTGGSTGLDVLMDFWSGLA